MHITSIFAHSVFSIFFFIHMPGFSKFLPKTTFILRLRTAEFYYMKYVCNKLELIRELHWHINKILEWFLWLLESADNNKHFRQNPSIYYSSHFFIIILRIFLNKLFKFALKLRFLKWRSWKKTRQFCEY